jgi:hypothetical protein
MSDKFRIKVHNGWGDWEGYFINFCNHCAKVADDNNWQVDTVMNYELKPLGGKLIKTSTQGWFLRWDNESSHTMFVLRWS